MLTEGKICHIVSLTMFNLCLCILQSKIGYCQSTLVCMIAETIRMKVFCISVTEKLISVECIHLTFTFVALG